jgi:phenylalanyl-tRNA synthetase alpha chain
MDIQEIEKEIKEAGIKTAEELEAFRIKYLGSKNVLKDLFARIKEVPNEQKKAFGQQVNALKELAQSKFSEVQDALQDNNASFEKLDLTLPGIPSKVGTRHPLTLTMEEIVNIFKRIGFNVSEGPEIEDDWHNFTALNLPDEHPARDMQDTFFVEQNPDWLLRTHTSSVQARVMENQKPPIRTITPGRVYRNEAISARAHCFFHQVEGLYIDKNVTFADLKQTIDYFAKALFGDKARIRMRPSYFPFTEPSAEVDVSCTLCDQKGCNVCKYTGWLEILGCGMVDPNVLENCKIDPDVYSGFAFGMGVERIAQLKYQVKDLRLYSENDVQFLNQFKSEL